MQTLSASEISALRNALDNPDFSAAFIKFCSNKKEKFTNKCRDQENQIPETLDADMRKRATVAQLAAFAKTYGQIESELRKVAMQSIDSDSEAE